MLKRFFLGVLSSFIGAWIAIALFGVVIVVAVIGLLAKIGASQEMAGISKGSVLAIELKGAITEVAMNPDFNYMDVLQGDISRPSSLLELTTAIAEAEVNKNISAICLKCEGVSAGPATLNALREALIKFKTSGKPVYAFGENYSNGDYFVASAADIVFVNPDGMVDLKGMGSTGLYMKDLFDKLGITFQVVKVGTFKSAVEPYIMQKMSEPARAQLDTLFTNMWAYMRSGICSQRKSLTPSKIDTLISTDFVAYRPIQNAQKAGLVDSLLYGRQMDASLAALLGKKKDDIKYVTPSMMVEQTNWGEAYSSKNQIALLYAVGDIVDGGGNGSIDYQQLVPEIVKLADDKHVKGMVLRVNSPGGSAFGSDQIGEALDYFMSKGKKIAVSMGDYAASGGYWISAGADIIYADALTITGSIGIFGLIPNAKGLADKLGVNFETVSTNPEANFPTLYSPLNEKQLSVMQQYVEDGYDKFIERVSKGRKIPEARVRQIGEGRVWDAMTAKRIGLVDTIGGLSSALNWVADKANLGKEYDVAVYPKREMSIWDMIPTDGISAMEQRLADSLAGRYDKMMIRLAARLLSQKPVQARMLPITVNL